MPWYCQRHKSSVLEDGSKRQNQYSCTAFIPEKVIVSGNKKMKIIRCEFKDIRMVVMGEMVCLQSKSFSAGSRWEVWFCFFCPSTWRLKEWALGRAEGWSKPVMIIWQNILPPAHRFHCRTSKAEFGFYSFCCQRGVCGGSTVIVPSAADLFDSPAVGKPGSDWSSRTS